VETRFQNSEKRVERGDMKRLIEVDFPIFEVSEESAKEKNIRHGHISTLHIWWARRPLAACRAAIYASLVPAPEDDKELREKMNFVAELCKWENSLNEEILSKARKDILDANGGEPPKVLDCFAGGGSISLEALRLGCESHAVELNPVAVLILKATLEYPQKYGKKLVEDVESWGKWVLDEARKELGRFYPEETVKGYFSGDEEEGDKWIPVGYIWARTIKCQNPTCGAEIPLMRQFWLRKKTDSEGKIIWNDSIYLKPVIDKENKRVEFEIIKGKRIEGFDPGKGTRPTVKARASFVCPICNTTYDTNTIRKIANDVGFGQRMICVILHNPNRAKKKYRIAKEDDIAFFQNAILNLEDKIKEGIGEYSIIPDETLPINGSISFRVEKWGMCRWHELFNSRQLLSLVTFGECIRRAYQMMINSNYDIEYAKYVTTYLSFALDKLADYNSSLCRWIPDGEIIGSTFTRQAISMVWDYHELCPFSGSTGDWNSAIDWIKKVVERLRGININAIPIQGTATRIPYRDEEFDAIITDPPYYDNVGYSDISDFFYVWLKRNVGNLHPDLFATPLTPKAEEIVQEPARHNRNKDEAKKFYQLMMSKSFKEMNRVLNSSGVATIVFAHKSTSAWETLINALINSGLVPTASWPVHTERKMRLRGRESAALASSFFLTCRKREGNKEAYFKDIRKELEERIKERLEHFWSQGIKGADFFISAIGPAVEIYGKYAKVKKLSGEELKASELLEHVRRYVTEYALGRILKGIKLEHIDPVTRFYILWRWTYNGQEIEYDDARILSQAVGVELEKLWGKGNVVQKSGSKIKVLSPQDRKIEEIKDRHPMILIDALHKACLLWHAERGKELENFLSSTGYLNNPVFWETVQALSELLPLGDKEKMMIQGLLLKAPVVTSEERQITLERWSG